MVDRAENGNDRAGPELTDVESPEIEVAQPIAATKAISQDQDSTDIDVYGRFPRSTCNGFTCARPKCETRRRRESAWLLA
jgi:hypothetical protein